MNQENRVQEVSIRRMIFAVCYQWKKIIAAALALAVLLGGYQGARKLRQVNDTQQNKHSEQEYETAMAAYEAEKEMLDNSIAVLESNIADQKVFLGESELMRLDPQNVYQAKVFLYISTDYQIMPEMTYQDTDKAALILSAYRALLSTQEAVQTVAEAVGMETMDLKELINVYTEMDRVMQIAVYHSDGEMAEWILAELLDYLETQRDQIARSIKEHSVEQVFDTVGLGANEELAEKQGEVRLRLEECETSLDKLGEQRSALTKPTPTELTAADAVKSGIKWALLGAAAGAFLAVVIFCCGFIFGDKVYSGEELKGRYGIRNVGGFWSGEKKCDPIAAALMKVEGRISSNSEENLELLAAGINNSCGGAGTILLTGMGADELANQLQPRIGRLKLVSCGSLQTSADALQRLSGCDGVLLVEMRGVSRYSAVIREIDRVREAGKLLVGCIIAEC